MKRMVLIGAAMMAVGAAGWHLLLHEPAQTRIHTLQSHLAIEERKLSSYRQALETIAPNLQQYQDSKEATPHLEAALSGTGEVTALYQYLDSLCRRPELQLEEITPSLEQVIRFLKEWNHSPATTEIPISVRIKGKYRRLAELVESIETAQYFGRLISIDVRGAEELRPECLMNLVFAADLSDYTKVAIHE